MNKNIPEGWKIIKLGEVVEHVKDRIPNRDEWTFNKYIGGEHFNNGEIRIKSYGLIQGNEEVLGSAFHMRFKPGHVLYLSRNAHLRKSGVVNFEGVCSNVSYVLQANEKKLLQSLLPFILQTEDFTKHAINSSGGSTNPFINWKAIANYNLLLPTLKEQEKISKILWSIENTIEKIEKLMILNKKSLSLTSKKLLLKGISNQKLKKTDLGMIPEHWEISNLGAYFKMSSGSTPLRKKKDIYFGGNIPWVKTLDLNNSYINKTEEHITELGLKESNCKLLPKKSILIAMYGGFNQIGRTGILNFEATSNQAITALYPSKDFISEFINYFLIAFRDSWKNVAISSRKDPNITKSDIQKFLIVKPPVEEQEKIVSILEDIDNNLEQQKQHLENLKLLKKKLTNELISGNIKV